MRSKILLGLVALITFCAVSYFFIKSSNDHKECTTEILKYKDSNGNTIKEERHICNEKYNF